MSRISNAFADGPAFIPYLVAGDPSVEASREYVEALCRGGADVIELGLPFSEPIAEGPTIQRAVERSLAAGMTPERYFGFIEDLEVDVPIVCMTYYNLIYQFGPAEGPRPFVERAAGIGVDGFVVPDLPVEESDALVAACRAVGCDSIFIVAPTTTDDRLARIQERVSGYVYVQARLGTTGARAAVSAETERTLSRLSEWDIPMAVGFGIATADHARQIIALGADGIIVGSALVDIVAEGVDCGVSTGEIADRLEAKSRELAEGAAAARMEPEHK